MHDPETHLIPRAVAAALAATRGSTNSQFTINGDDYPTDDGTCVRDYVHVLDLAEAHVVGLEYLLAGGRNDVINLGCGAGYSIREIVTAVEEGVGITIPVCVGPRRTGDPARLVADVRKARAVLGWQARRELPEIVTSAIEFHRVQCEWLCSDMK